MIVDKDQENAAADMTDRLILMIQETECKTVSDRMPDLFPVRKNIAGI